MHIPARISEPRSYDPASGDVLEAFGAPPPPIPAPLTSVLRLPLALLGFYLRWILLGLWCATARDPFVGARRWERWNAWPRRSKRRVPMDRLDFWTLKMALRPAPIRALVGTLALPLLRLPLALRAVAVRGRGVRAAHGPSLLRQTLEIWLLQLRYPAIFAAEPEQYYLNELYRADRRADAPFLISAVHQNMLTRAVNGARDGSMDKREFARRCAEAALPHAHSVAEFDPGGKVRWLNGFAGLPAEDLFSKPALKANGTGAARWIWCGNGRYRSESGSVMDAEAVLGALRAAARQEPLLLQRRVRNHPEVEALVGETTATIRFAALLAPDGSFEPLLAIHRSAPRDSAVDNSAKGGVASAIDLATGVLSQAMHMGDAGVRFSSEHPRTGRPIEGVRLPFWSETVHLIERAHRVFREYPLVGWDVAITREGPVLIEANIIWVARSLQAAHRVPLGRHLYAQRLLEAVERRVCDTGN
jgi:hypothetical protein